MDMRVVEIDRSPPRRLLASLRWRDFKLTQDRHVWEQATAPVRAYEAQGYELQRVVIDWGASTPDTPSVREQKARELTGCFAPCELIMVESHHGRGSTRVELSRAST